MPTDTGILTADQREALQGDPDQADDEHQRRYVKAQVRNAFARDAPVLWETLQSAERREILSPDREPDRPAEGTDEDRSDADPEALHLGSGAAALLAFLYLGLEEQPADQRPDDFETVLRNAMERVASRNGWVLDDFEFAAEFDRDPDDEKLRRRFDEGRATIEEATELLRRDVITSAEYAGYAQRH